ncbi:unnamed protein product [Symbiodinium sp. CCMP2592]|nr:unnamed protein product [Symbiodinium sp. CCMP2592]
MDGEEVDFGGLAPIPEDLPLPFGEAAEGHGAPGDSGEGPPVDRDAAVDWLDLVRDHRVLRGGVPPAGLPGRDPASLLTRNDDTASSSASSSSNMETNVGVTSRFGRTRSGLDRWHHPDGSVRNRARERREAAPESHDPQLDHAEPFTVVGVGEVDGLPVVKATSFYGDSFQVWASPGSIQPEASTTAGSSTSGGDDESSGPDSSATDASVGFWRHGVWHSRARTVTEQRQHRGGMGPQRAARKHQRMVSYMEGSWKPAWLVRYAREKEARALQQAGLGAGTEVQKEEPVVDPKIMAAFTGKALETEDQTAKSQETSSWGEPTHGSEDGNWELDWDPWSGQSWHHDWWNQNGVSSTWSTAPSSWSPAWSSSTWGTWQSWEDWSCTTPSCSTTSSSTTSSSTSPVLPHFGLEPVVEPALPDVISLMQMTGSERATLQEAGIPRADVDRLEQFLQALDTHNDQDLGPEARWALGHLLERVEDGMATIESIYGVLVRRLLPRGYLPIQRVPAEEMQRWQLFNWVRNLAGTFVGCFDRNLQVRLQPGEGPQGNTVPDTLDPVTTPGSTVRQEPSAGTDLVAPSSSSSGGSDRTRSRSRSRGVVSTSSRRSAASSHEAPSLNSEVALNEHGQLVCVLPARPDEPPNGPPPPIPVNLPRHLRPGQPVPVPVHGSVEEALNGALLGIWTESTASSTTLSSTTFNLEEDMVGDMGALVQLWSSSAGVGWTSTSTSTLVSCMPLLPDSSLSPGSCWDDFALAGGWCSTSTSTSTTTLSPEDVVRDAVNRELVYGSVADIVDVLHRLQARQRRLNHLGRLIGVAIEEALTWMPVPANSMVFNSPTMEMHIWGVVNQEANFGMGASSSGTTQVSTTAAALLQPGLPEDLRSLWNSLPHMEPRTIVGLRRRAWRHNARALHVQDGHAIPEGWWPSEDDQVLYLIQTDENMGCYHLDHQIAVFHVIGDDYALHDHLLSSSLKVYLTMLLLADLMQLLMIDVFVIVTAVVAVMLMGLEVVD